MSLTAEPYCFECWPYDEEPDPGFYTMLTMSGHPTAVPDVQPAGPEYLLCQEWYHEGELEIGWCGSDELPQEDPAVAELLAMCIGDEPNPEWVFLLCGDQGCETGPDWSYGEWTLKVWVESNNFDVSAGEIVAGPAEADFRVAEDCAAATFVPEPGTIALLGSGLVGLAGYAALRWRTRE
jgi:hypothetical protein